MKFKKLPSDKKYDGLKEPLPFTNARYKEPLGAWEAKRDMMTCLGCSTPQKSDNFIKLPQGATGYLSATGSRRAFLCKPCMEALVKKFVEQDEQHSPYRALYRLCAFMGIYYDDVLAHQVVEGPNTWEDGQPVSKYIHWSLLYCRAATADPKISKMDFYNSDNFDFDGVVNHKKRESTQEEEAILSERDKQNRASIVAIYHYDPFEDEPVSERGKMYEDLITLASDDLTEDLVKQKAALEIVRSFNRINKINKALVEFQSSPESMAENADTIKALLDQKTKETNMVSAFSKDNGFTERYAMSKSKGSGTLSAIVRDMETYGYDPGIANKFDIETESAMKQVADISAEAMFKQLALSETDYAGMVREQAIYIREMQDTMSKQSEELRLLKEKLAKEELLKEYERELQIKGLNPQEIADLIKKEINYKPYIVGNTYFTEQDFKKEPELTAEDVFGGES